jgi:hypothetical protein
MSERDEAGRFLPGNRFWEARSTAGPKPKFKTPEELWAACVEYFEWVEENPLHAGHVVSFQGVGHVIAVPKMRAMTIGGLCIFLDIEETTWRGWRLEGGPFQRSDLQAVIARVEQIIYEQKFTGAAADLLNPNIIARDLGLADKKELTGAGGGPIKTEEIGVSARERLAAELDRIASAERTSEDPGDAEQ